LSIPPAACYVGLDWASETHAVCVIDVDGTVLTSFTTAHSADGITSLIARLAAFGEPIDVPVGIERPDGRLVDLLLEAGHPVVPVSPNAIKSWREGEVISGAKSDLGDALVIAEYLRLRQHRLTPAAPYSGQTKALRTVVRTRDDLVAVRVATVNQLAAVLDAHWPGAKAIFADLESKIALAFLNRYPTAIAAQHLGEKRLAGFCQAHGYSGRRSPAQLLARLRNAPPGTTDLDLTGAVHDSVTALVTVITTVNTALKKLEASISTRLGEHPDGAIFTSLPRSGRINAAQMLAEWGDSRESYARPDSIAALAGCTPVTKASGKHKAVSFRWACNKRFRLAITTFADNSRHASPWAAQIYRQAIDSGKDHPHAIRILARAWIRVIWRCWHNHQPYDPNLHGSAREHVLVA
jgi:transposase